VRVPITLTVNSVERRAEVEPRTLLVQYLRNELALTGAHIGCETSQCGACTVLMDGQRILSCLTLAVACEGKAVTTIEGIAVDGVLHPLQQAFVDHDALQCGFCTPGQILSAIACIAEGHAGDDELREFMSGNICRCAAYPNIVAAIRQVADQSAGGGDAAL
jgi:xanthine dehydrogenase YagT iron-sulfur-binding subunit